MAKITKKQVKSALKKALTGAKKGYEETSKFIGTYAPKVHRYTGGVAEGITKSFAVKAPSKRMYLDLTPTQRSRRQPRRHPRIKQHRMAMKRIKGTTQMKMTNIKKKKIMKNRVDWNNIGVNF